MDDFRFTCEGCGYEYDDYYRAVLGGENICDSCYEELHPEEE